MAMNDAAARKLRIGHGIGHRAHPRRRHMTRLQKFFPFLGAAREHDLRQCRDLAFVIGVAFLIAPLDHLRAAEHGPQTALLAQIAGASMTIPSLYPRKRTPSRSITIDFV